MLNLSPYTYNSSNELLSTPNGSYTYDKDGEMLTRPDGTQFSWDYEGRVAQAVLPNGGGTVTFHYDPFGKRIQKSGLLGTTNYFYDGRDILETADQNGNPLARYAGALEVDEPLSELVSGTMGYYEQDGNSTVTSLTDMNGNALNTYTYDTFGNLTASTLAAANPFQYTGREFDSETGIYEYRARYYDQTVGRFLSEDPRRFAVGINFYDYVRNSPASLKDPLGAFPVWGWWCGPNWTGGKFGPYSPGNTYHAPWGATDIACMHHDICYYECRRDHPCSKADRAKCMRQCDDMLLNEAPYSPIGNLVSSAVWFWNKNPDTGDNAKNCPCDSSSPPGH